MNTSGKLKGKDLINIGIYAAIYCSYHDGSCNAGIYPNHDANAVCTGTASWRDSIYAFHDQSGQIWNAHNICHQLSGCFCGSQGWDIGHFCLELCLVFLLI